MNKQFTHTKENWMAGTYGKMFRLDGNEGLQSERRRYFLLWTWSKGKKGREENRCLQKAGHWASSKGMLEIQLRTIFFFFVGKFGYRTNFLVSKTLNTSWCFNLVSLLARTPWGDNWGCTHSLRRHPVNSWSVKEPGVLMAAYFTIMKIPVTDGVTLTWDLVQPFTTAWWSHMDNPAISMYVWEDASNSSSEKLRPMACHLATACLKIWTQSPAS